MVCNITRNGFTNQRDDTLAGRDASPNVRGTDLRNREMQLQKTLLQPARRNETVRNACAIDTLCYANHSNLNYRVPCVPGLQRPRLVLPDQQKKSRA